VIFLKDIVSGVKADILVKMLRSMINLRDTPIVVYGGKELKQQNEDFLKKNNLHIVSGETADLVDFIDRFSVRKSS
ncbi:MAG: hypothetical protein WCX16_04590, partial [Candidatus Omnitrophota bacterium]